MKKGLGGVWSIAGRLGVVLRRRTYLKATATTSVGQERSRGIWCKIEVMCMLRMSYEIGSRCWSAYLGWRELPATAGQLGLEGQIGWVGRASKMANTARGEVIFSSNQLVMHGWRVQIQLPDELQDEAMFGGGSEIC